MSWEGETDNVQSRCLWGLKPKIPWAQFTSCFWVWPTKEINDRFLIFFIFNINVWIFISTLHIQNDLTVNYPSTIQFLLYKWILYWECMQKSRSCGFQKYNVLFNIDKILSAAILELIFELWICTLVLWRIFYLISQLCRRNVLGHNIRSVCTHSQGARMSLATVLYSMCHNDCSSPRKSHIRIINNGSRPQHKYMYSFNICKACRLTNFKWSRWNGKTDCSHNVISQMRSRYWIIFCMAFLKKKVDCLSKCDWSPSGEEISEYRSQNVLDHQSCLHTWIASFDSLQIASHRNGVQNLIREMRGNECTESGWLPAHLSRGYLRQHGSLVTVRLIVLDWPTGLFRIQLESGPSYSWFERGIATLSERCRI